jgi:asparagine synthase (glutamine-hydrolysing)
MCGIAGVYNVGGSPADPERIRKMTSVLSHRGPDSSGIWTDGPVGLGHRRLSILGLGDQGLQPMGDGNTLVHNGEIYNYLELRTQLASHGHEFQTATDTEVILKAYRQWGPDCVTRFNGMWAFALWDSEQRGLFLSRDRFGIKPLYYVEGSAGLLFASEPKALLLELPELRAPNEVTLARYLADGYLDDTADTMFRQIRRLLPAHNLWIDQGGVRTSRYWELTVRQPEQGLQRAVEALGTGDSSLKPRFSPASLPVCEGIDEPARMLRALLLDSVRLRLRSDVPVGTCLSGGLDSTSIVSLAQQLRAEPMKTFCSIHSYPECDERSYSRLVAEAWKTDSFEVESDPYELRDLFPRLTYYQDEPTVAPGNFSQWKVMALAEGKVTVLLDGQGGDEILGGYMYYARNCLQDRAHQLRKIPGGWERLSREARVWEDVSGMKFEQALRRAWRSAGRPRWWPSGRKRGRRSLPAYLKADLWNDFPETDDDVVTDGSSLARRLSRDLSQLSMPHLLRYEDRNSMAFSLEARTPFLDYRLVEYCFSLPFHFKMEQGWTKLVLRHAMNGFMPAEVVSRRDKMGFPTPVAQWFRGPLHSWLEEIFRSGSLASRGLFVVPELLSLLQNHVDGADRSWELWRVLSTEYWFRQFIDGEGFL